MKVIGVDIGGTNTELGIVDSRDGIVKLSKFKTKGNESFKAYIDLLTENIRLLSLEHNIQCIGIGAPNYNSKTETFCPVNFPWDDLEPFNLKQHIEAELNIPTFMVTMLMHQL